MMATKITYNGQQIASTDETPPVAVTYNGQQIASLASGDTKTLKCDGKVAASDIAVGSKTLKCNGKLMASDVGVEVEQAVPSLVGRTFTIKRTRPLSANYSNAPKASNLTYTLSISDKTITGATWRGFAIDLDYGDDETNIDFINDVYVAEIYCFSTTQFSGAIMYKAYSHLNLVRQDLNLLSSADLTPYTYVVALFTNNRDITITFTGGSDATREDLIAWFENPANATEITP